MKQANTNPRWMRAWRLAVIAVGALILCSCRGPVASPLPAPASASASGVAAQDGSPAGQAARQNAAGPSGVQQAGYFAPAGNSPGGPPCEPCIMARGMEAGVPVPYTSGGPWVPPGIVPPWPADEHLCDGGNAGPPVRVGAKGELVGLEMEDTVARYSTLDGRTLVEPSNKVCLYSPRFNAVRQVVDVEIDQQRNRATGVSEPTKPMTPRTSEPVVINTKNLQAVREIGANPALQLRSRKSHATLYAELRPRGFDNFYRVYENVSVVRTGIYVGHEEAIVARAAQAAVVWSHMQSPHVYLNSFGAGATVVNQKPQLTYSIGSAPNPKLRIVKLASTPVAEPGDEVSFTIRFDNVGNEPIGSVEIVDSLTTRLEYVPGSAQCSVNSRFTTQPNEGESLIVRCILGDPLPAGKGGVFRFRCIVK